MRELHTAVEIAASADQVWAVLTDFAAFPEWNPFLTTVTGEAAVGAHLEVRLQPPGGRALTVRPTVLAADPARELRWIGHLLFPGLFDGEHRFVVERAPMGGPTDVVRFVQAERFTGVLVPLIWKRLEPSTRAGFEAMNAALKQRVELAPA
jgi:hypothetical protein